MLEPRPDSSLDSKIMDASIFSTQLSAEVVTPGELEGMSRMLDALLDETGTQSTINGIPARVSVVEREVKVTDTGRQNQRYWGRVFCLDEKDVHGNEVRGIVFDETPGLPVLTPNPLAVRFSSDYTGRPTLIVDNELDPVVNDPTYAEFVKGILKDLSYKAEAVKLERKQAEKAEKEARRNRIRYAIQGARETGGKVLGWALAATAGTGLVVGLGYVLSRIDVEFPEDFDDRDIELPADGQTISLGKQASPAFSQELYESQELSPDDVPTLPASTTNDDDDVLSMDDLARQIWVESSKEGKNCSTVNVAQRLPLDTELLAWTDFTSSDGKSRADELEVLFETDKVKVCWNGQERHEDDDPRVVVKLKAPEAAETTPQG